ncbi:MAG: adenosine kinase [Lentisphaeria bacterium]|nr:adenosine kinase [Lentisphaeria bacterium]
MPFSVLGIGSPLVDYNAVVSDDFIAASLSGDKGGTVHLDPVAKAALLRALPQLPLRTPGGSAANTINLAAALGVDAAFAGVAGNDDDGKFFLDNLAANGAASFIRQLAGAATGCCISLVTPDAERTMRSCLGVSMAIDRNFVAALPLEEYEFVHIEGYMMQLADFPEILQEIKERKCRISFDLSSFELAARYAENLPQWLKYVDILFVNFAEQHAFTGCNDVASALETLSKYVPVTVLKNGADGAFVHICGGELSHIPALAPADEVCDTTAAGDCFAAGFFYGISMGAPLPLCGRCGALCAAEIVKIQGSLLPENNMKHLQSTLKKEIARWNTK